MNFLNCYMHLGLISTNDVYCYDATHNLVYDTRHSIDTAIYGCVPDVVLTSLMPRYIYVLSNLALTEMDLKRFLANDIACAVIYISRRNLHLSPVWTEELMVITGCEDPSSVGDVIAVMDQLSSSVLQSHFQDETLPVLISHSTGVGIGETVDDTVSFDASEYESDCEGEVTANSGNSDLLINSDSGDEFHENLVHEFDKYLHVLSISNTDEAAASLPLLPPQPPQTHTIHIALDKHSSTKQPKSKPDVISPQSVSNAISSPLSMDLNNINTNKGASNTNMGMDMGANMNGHGPVKVTAKKLHGDDDVDVVRASIERLIS